MTTDPKTQTSVRHNLFVIPLEDGTNSLVYAPLQKVAFVANAPMADRVTGFIQNPGSDSDLYGWLHDLGVLDSSPTVVDTSFEGAPRPPL